MNKKFLSAILFGALMVTATGTFVSCKDYDDDIDRIDTELNDLKSKLDALQTKVDAGKYVTNVATTADGITITLSDGSSYPITNGKDGDKGEAGAAGDKVEINEDGFFIINGKVTEWKAVAKDAAGQTVKIKTPTVSEDGCWVFYDEKEEAHPTTIKVAPVTAVQNEDQTWTLTVWGADGKSQTIKLPTAASMLTELDLAGWATVADASKDFSLTNLKNGTENELSIEYAWIEKIQKANYGDNGETNWSAQKDVTKKQVLTTLAATNTKLVARIAPAELDPSTFKFTLQDSKGNVLPITLGTPEKFTGTLTRAASSSLAFIPMDITAATYDNARAYWINFNKDQATEASNTHVYSLVEASNYRSSYAEFNIKATKAEVTKQSVVKVDGKEKATAQIENSKGDKVDYFEVDLNKANKLEFGSKPEYVYDYYVEPVDATVAELFGYSPDKKNGTFTLAKSADQITKAPLALYVYALHLDGKIYQSTIYVKPSSRLINEVVLNAGNVLIAQTTDKINDVIPVKKMAFTVDLADMFTALGTDNTKIWKSETLGANVSAITSVKIGNDAQNDVATNTTFAWIKSDGKTTANIHEAVKMKVYVPYNPKLSVGKGYTMGMDFKHGSEVLNSIKVTYTPVLPALSEFIAKKTELWNNDATVLMAYFNDPTADDIKDLTADQKLASKFAIEQGFTKFGKKDVATITLSLDDKQKIGNTLVYNKVDAEALATIKDNVITLNTAKVDDDDNVIAYAKDLNVKVGIKYLAVYDYTETDAYKADLAAANFKIKVQSALEAGTIKSLIGNEIKMEPASAGEVWKVTAANLSGYTYSEQPYNIFQVTASDNKPYYKYTYIRGVEFASPDASFYTVVDKDGKAGSVAVPPVWGDKAEIASYVALKPGNTTQETKTTLNVTVTDYFGYSKYVEVPLVINAAKK